MKKILFFALVAMMLVGMNSCQYKNPALEESQNPMVKEFEVANLMLGKSKTEAENTLKERGYVLEESIADTYYFEKKEANVEIEFSFKLGSKNKVYAAGAVFEPEVAGTYMSDFANLKDVVTTFGGTVKISTKEECKFSLFVNSSSEAAMIDYNTMLTRIDSSTNGFTCIWSAESASIEELERHLEDGDAPMVYFDCGAADYMSYYATLAVTSQKYK